MRKLHYKLRFNVVSYIEESKEEALGPFNSQKGVNGFFFLLISNMINNLSFLQMCLYIFNFQRKDSSILFNFMGNSRKSSKIYLNLERVRNGIYTFTNTIWDFQYRKFHFTFSMGVYRSTRPINGDAGMKKMITDP